jgi:hypothetical protein
MNDTMETYAQDTRTLMRMQERFKEIQQEIRRLNNPQLAMMIMGMGYNLEWLEKEIARRVAVMD